MKTKLWLDDRRPVPDETHFHAHTAQMALYALEHNHFSEASLDHDLGSPRLDGAWMLRMAAQRGIPLPETVHLHTQNPVGRANMVAQLESMGYSRDHTRFATFQLDPPPAA